MNKHRQEIRKESKEGNEIFFKIISQRNKINDEIWYECLSAMDEFSPYDIQLQKHNVGDWGDITTSYHEIKTRSEKYHYYNFTDSWVDLPKIHSLQKIAYTTGKDVFVNMIYEGDRTMLIWKIEADKEYKTAFKTNITWHSQSAAYGEEIKIPEKNFVLLPNEEAVKVRYNI